ncbi:hypothetical protein [Terrarubrum flagellatum]|uniref:hypothetical protein n=1 Tax=Terrirubrum flagellatum TaxID=2895980 RepID=UPI0031450810
MEAVFFVGLLLGVSVLRARGFLSAIFLAFACMSARAATIQVLPASDGLPPFILIIGEMAIEDVPAFANTALPLPNAIVSLSSDGGKVLAGIEIGKAIRLKGFSTLVLDNQTCASACALAWLGGAKRFASQSARIGFHAAYMNTQRNKEVASVGNALVGAYLNQLGLSSSAIAYVSKAAPDDMQWLNFDEARRYGIEVSALPGADKSTTMGGSTSPAPSQPAPQVATTTPGMSKPPTASPPLALQAPTSPTQAVKPPAYFADYPTPFLHPGPNAQPVFDTQGKYAFRTRLRAAASAGPKFGGRYAVAQWGCGTSCVTGGIVDSVTGAVTFFPGTFSGWGSVDSSFDAVQFRMNSSLIVLSGMFNEVAPIGSHYFNFDGSSFRYLGSVLTSDDFRVQYGVQRLPHIAR